MQQHSSRAAGHKAARLFIACNLFVFCFLLPAIHGMAETIVVKNIRELNQANDAAKPGDIIVLQNGEWKDVRISLDCKGTKEQPVMFKAQTPGKVLITGHSFLKIGGDFIVVDGLYFNNGFAGSNAVIDFRINKDHLANHCRVTNTVVNDFNNKRMEENYWVSFSGKNNQVDHCSFFNKKNMGVLIAVILDDDRSRENFHSIDHNYFGTRLPLASNSGEIIRVGVSQHCEFNSNTQITDNYFEHCDGETEIVSIKSCSNVVRNNLFKECQGGVVLRHGNYNLVENNIFLGNDKEGTGGVRVINKGQWIVNNLFYKCRGVDFRSPLSVMNGIPNSPAFRYVQVSDAVIANNTFYNCSPASFCEGSDTERTLPPVNVDIINNAFYNKVDPVIYKAYDDMNGFRFTNNNINSQVKQSVPNGFQPTVFATRQAAIGPVAISTAAGAVIPDSLQQVAQQRLGHALSSKKGFTDIDLLKRIQKNAYSACGAKWFARPKPVTAVEKVSCKTAEDIQRALATTHPGKLVIELTGKSYTFSQPLFITSNTEFHAAGNAAIIFSSAPVTMTHLLQIQAGNTLALDNINLDLSDLQVARFITTDTSGSSNHSVFTMKGCHVKNLDTGNGAFFYASKSSLCDSIIIYNNTFENNACELFSFEQETGKKGYYNVEKLFIRNNSISGNVGSVLNMLRGGNDESTLGPTLVFSDNILKSCQPVEGGIPMIWLWGTQKSFIINNQFENCYNNANGILVKFEDAVRADHVLADNKITNSGSIIKDRFVRE